MIKKIILKSFIFQGIDENYIKSLLDPKSILTFEVGEFIVHQNEQGTGMYFILEGEVAIVAENTGDSKEESLIKVLKKGEFFGEVCMFAKQKRTASAKAKTDVKLLYLDGEQFRKEIEEGNANTIKISFNISRILIDHLHHTNKLLVELNQQLRATKSWSEISRFKKKLMQEILL